MGIRRLIGTAMAVACLALAACGSEGERPDSGVTLPERSTTVPAGTEEPDRTTAPGVTRPDDGTATTASPTTGTATTATPTTRPPTTATPTTDTPVTTVPATDPQAVADESSPWWPWLLAGVAIIGLIAFVASRRSGQAPTWKERTAAALDDATRLATHLAAVSPEGAAMVADQDAGQLAGLAATLSARETETNDQAARRAIGAVRNQVQILHGVVDGIAMGSTVATPAALGYLKEQATTLHGTTARARAELFPAPPATGATQDVPYRAR